MKTLPPTQLNEAQIMLLNTFSVPMTEQVLKEFKKMLLSFHSKLLIAEADRIWNERGMTTENAVEISKEHKQ